MSVVLVASVVPRPGEREAVIAAFEAAIPQVHDEPGCELYALHESKDRIVMIEKWADLDAVAAHAAAPALADLRAALTDRVVGAMDVMRLTARPAGDAALGLL
jgi:quinol monooxygenase YgiN